MTQEQIGEIARRQSARELGCESGDFLKTEPVVVLSGEREGARCYHELPFSLELVSYGNNVVASVLPEFRALTEEFLRRFPPEHCFETPNLHALNEALLPFGQKLCYMPEYFLPELDFLRALPCRYELRVLGPTEFQALYQPQWSNALCEKRRQLDRLCVGAYDGTKLIGLAGCSADCADMWQIGVDVLPERRRQGVASAVTSRLALEVLERGKVPFYSAAWSNLKSVRNAIRSGFRPAWAELCARPVDYVDRLNGKGGDAHA